MTQPAKGGGTLRGEGFVAGSKGMSSWVESCEREGVRVAAGETITVAVMDRLSKASNSQGSQRVQRSLKARAGVVWLG
jgi:hypothetical protein